MGMWYLPLNLVRIKLHSVHLYLKQSPTRGNHPKVGAAVVSFFFFLTHQGPVPRHAEYRVSVPSPFSMAATTTERRFQKHREGLPGGSSRCHICRGSPRRFLRMEVWGTLGSSEGVRLKAPAPARGLQALSSQRGEGEKNLGSTPALPLYVPGDLEETQLRLLEVTLGVTFACRLSQPMRKPCAAAWKPFP